MKQTTCLKELAVLIAVLMLSACSDNPENAETTKTEESQIETAVEQDLNAQQSSEEKSNEQEQSTEEGEKEKVYLSEEFLSQLKDGQMPGSKIQFTHSIEDVKNILGEPDSIGETEGGEVLEYGNYGYVHGYVPSSVNQITAMYYLIPNEEGVTGEDFINAWGEPQSKYESDHPYPAYVMRYLLNNYEVRLEMDDSQQGVVKFLVLIKIEN